jgi:uncharacterized protein
LLEVAAIILFAKSGVLGPVRRALAAVGQMAFSNHLFQSVVTSILFLGWGFGFAGRLDYAEQLHVVVAIWATRVAISPLWLAHFRFGPAEWLWRSLTYWQRQLMRPARCGLHRAEARSPGHDSREPRSVIPAATLQRAVVQAAAL